jgi:hypothetical protein
MLHRPIDLDDVLPRNVPVYYGGARVDVVRFTKAGPVFDNARLLSSFYIIGNSRVAWIEWCGWLSVLAALLFAAVHGALRLLGGK